MFYLFILKITGVYLRSIFEIYSQKELIYQRSTYIHIERFGMLKVKGEQIWSEVETPVCPTSFMLAGRCIIRIGWKIGTSMCMHTRTRVWYTETSRFVDDSVKGKVICKAINRLEKRREELCTLWLFVFV